MANYSSLATELVEYLSASADAKHRRCTEDFTHGEIRILAHLMRHGGSSTPGEICEQLTMTSPRVSAAVANLVKKSLVSRETDTRDKRRSHIHITEEGRALAEEKRRELVDSLARILGTLGEQDASEYVRIVGRICSIDAE